MNSKQKATNKKQKIAMKNKIKKYFGFFFPVVLLFFALPAEAIVCPVCTIAVGACVGLAEYLGIDDTISGIWVGGFLMSLVFWTVNWLEGKNIRFYGRKILTIAVYYAFTLGPLYWRGIVGHPLNKFWGLDKLVLGVFFGSLFFVLSTFINDFLKKKNDGQVYFPFQKVAVPVVVLGFLSGIFYFLTC